MYFYSKVIDVMDAQMSHRINRDLTIGQHDKRNWNACDKLGTQNARYLWYLKRPLAKGFD